MKNAIIPVFLATLFISCQSLHQNGAAESTADPVKQKPVEEIPSYTPVEQAIHETEALLVSIEKYSDELQRDIDDREWLMAYINQSADIDLLLVQAVYENIKYRNWTSDEKREYLDYFYRNSPADQGIVFQRREAVWAEIGYLLEHSRLLHDTPWMVRDYYDEKTEFSYWYLIYTGRQQYPLWLNDVILPALLQLIPEDRITAATYLWLKSIDSLCSMKQEINKSGYPWTRLNYLIDINEFLQKEIKSLYRDESASLPQNQGCLF